MIYLGSLQVWAVWKTPGLPERPQIESLHLTLSEGLTAPVRTGKEMRSWNGGLVYRLVPRNRTVGSALPTKSTLKHNHYYTAVPAAAHRILPATLCPLPPRSSLLKAKVG